MKHNINKKTQTAYGFFPPFLLPMTYKRGDRRDAESLPGVNCLIPNFSSIFMSQSFGGADHRLCEGSDSL